MEDDAYQRNLEIDNLLDTWEWCSRRLHVKWQRKRRLRNGCFVGITSGLLGETSLTARALLRAMKLPESYRTLPQPLLNRKRLLIFWKVKPGSLLELCVGCHTKSSPLTKPLNRLRSAFHDNSTLDDLAKKMRGREERFGSEWYTEGHHPESDYRLLKKEMRPLWKQLRDLILQEQAVVEKLAQEVLAQGWQFGEIPASWRVRKTPEKLLNRATRLKLWRVAQDILARNLSDEATLEALCQNLSGKITPSIKAGIEAQGYTADNVVDDMLNFDMRKSRGEITA
jgi:hypothetical protein